MVDEGVYVSTLPFMIKAQMSLTGVVIEGVVSIFKRKFTNINNFELKY